MSTWIDTDVRPPATEGEAKETVKALRQDLREEQRLRQRGDDVAARRTRGKAGQKMAALGRMLERRLVNYAEAKFGANNPHLVEEAVGDIFEQLYIDFMDLESTRNSFYETTFNRRVQWTALDVIKKVRTRHGMLAKGKVKPYNDVPMSIEGSEERTGEEEAEPLQVVDSESQGALERQFGPNLLRDVLAAMPDRKHVNVLALHMLKGYTFFQTAEALGISEKTARRYYNRAFSVAKRVVLKSYGSE